MNHIIIFSSAMVLLIVYSVVVDLLFTSKEYAIFAGSLFILVQFFIRIQTSISAYYEIAIQKKHLTDELVMEAFETLAGKYMLDETEGEDSTFYR